MQLIGEMLDNAAKANLEKEAVVFEDSTLTYREFNQNINRLTNGLKKLGIRKGDLVMVQLVNSPEIIVSHYAIIKAGAIAVNIAILLSLLWLHWPPEIVNN